MVEVVILVEVAIAIEPVVLVLEGFFRPFYGNLLTRSIGSYLRRVGKILSSFFVKVLTRMVVFVARY